MNIILVEGMDGAGKTTLIEKLKAINTDILCKHFTHKDVEATPDPILRYAQHLEYASEQQASTVIFDRGWYSDMIYENILRGGWHAVSAGQISIVERLCKSYGDLTVVFVTASVNSAWARCKQRGEDLITSKDLLKKVSAAYNEAIKLAKLSSLGMVYEVKT